MNKRINVILPEETLSMLDRVAEKGERSRVIDLALKFYIEKKGRSNLKARLKEGYRARSEESLEIATEWFDLDEEAWSEPTP
jgi:CopG family transcriptional regulator/antitoxin EndoAI